MGRALSEDARLWRNSEPILLKYPFFSADSTTWMSAVKYGSYVSMNWKKFGIDQLARHRFQANLERVAKDLVPFGAPFISPSHRMSSMGTQFAYWRATTLRPFHFSNGR